MLKYVIIILALGLSACHTFHNEQYNYKQYKAINRVKLPKEMSEIAFNDYYNVPDIKVSKTSDNIKPPSLTHQKI